MTPHDVDQMQELIDATKENGVKMDVMSHKIEMLSEQHKDIIRWLLWVVCIIAVGQRALELAQGIWGRTEAKAAAEERVIEGHH